MKPLYLELQAFGPYIEKQTIDFEALSEKGIFIIKGKTGSGKTTIFDAMTFALYGGSTGSGEKVKNGRNDLEEWRCSQAPESLDTYVYFVFSVRNRKYYFRRSLMFKRKNFSLSYEAGELLGDGGTIPFFNNPKQNELNKKAEELIGLSKDQFRQVVLLPQGQFEQFLTASSDEKTTILNRIFDAERWKAYSDSFYAAAKSKKDALDNEKQYIENALAEEGLSEIDALTEKINGMAEEKAALEAAHKAFDGEKKQLMLNADIGLSEQFRPLHELENKIKALNGRKQEIETDREIFGKAAAADAMRGLIEKSEAAETNYKSRSLAHKRLSDALPSAEEYRTNAEKAKEELLNCSPVKECENKIGELNSKRHFYEALVERSKTLDEAVIKYNTAKADYELSETNYNTAKSEAAGLAEKFSTADKEAQNYRDRYFAGMYGEIAAELIENEACPVCGSKEHPCPASKTADSVTKSEVDKKEKEREKAKTAWEKADSALKEFDNDRQNKLSLMNSAETEKAKAKADYDNAAENLIDGISSISELENRIAELEKTIADFNRKLEILEKRGTDAAEKLTKLKSDIASAETEKNNAQNEYESSKNALENELKAKGYDSVETVKTLLMPKDALDTLNKKIIAYETELKNSTYELSEKEKELSGKIEPDSSRFKERQSEINLEAKNYNEKIGFITNETERLKRKQGELSEKNAHYKEEIAGVDDDLAFAKKLRGDSGIGLQRYVLAIMFNRVINEANRMLSKVHGGRYALFRTDEKGEGRKRGLELKVHDNRSPEKEGRSVSMLSGGEKFLVSLSLSIGMSAVAQKSGVIIDALFIDEGFGTLDESSINDAMDVLESVRRSSGMIGIISHVKVLEDNIPTQLEIIKSDKGSSIKTI